MKVEIHRHTPETPWTYRDLDVRQREIAREVREGGAGCILLSEVAPVVTMGRRATVSELPLGEPYLREKGIDVLFTDRGGLATYHGPGQWVLFVVEKLERLTGDPRGVKDAVCRLLKTAEEVGRLYDESVVIRDGLETGVWTSKGKFAAVGVHVEEGILLHGLAVNGFKTAQSFVGLRPCGLDAPVDFLLDGRGRPAQDREVLFKELGDRLAETAKRSFS